MEAPEHAGPDLNLCMCGSIWRPVPCQLCSFNQLDVYVPGPC